jgi:hypothetical protein
MMFCRRCIYLSATAVCALIFLDCQLKAEEEGLVFFVRFKGLSLSL